MFIGVHTIGGKRVKLQHDNASSHGNKIYKDILKLNAEHGWDIVVAPQPPQSPDLNVLDLGLFACIQALQHETQASTIDQLVDVV